MIRKCTNKDYGRIMSLVSKEPTYNLFIIADIERYGVVDDFLEVWGDFRNDEITAILLRYYNNFVVYSGNDEFDITGFVKILKQKNEFRLLSGKKEVIDLFKNRLDFSKSRDTYFSKLVKANFNDLNLSDSLIKSQKATIEDAESLFELRKKIDEFELPVTLDSIKRKFRDCFGRTFVIKESGKILSAASTTAECTMSAMIGGVMTDPDNRKKGYATACVIGLCRELINEDKIACLFYDNPSAGSIYRRIGFKEIGTWTMCVK